MNKVKEGKEEGGVEEITREKRGVFEVRGTGTGRRENDMESYLTNGGFHSAENRMLNVRT